jgi:hypothetical protein
LRGRWGALLSLDTAAFTRAFLLAFLMYKSFCKEAAVVWQPTERGRLEEDMMIG